MVTLKDIAVACGVSPATVSRAINAEEDSLSEKAISIRRMAREMGYQPNPAALALKTNRSRCLGVIYEDRMNHEYFSSILDDFRMEAEERGYSLAFLARDGGDMGDYAAQSAYRSMDGILILQADFNHDRIRSLLSSGRPLVLIDHSRPSLDSVASDNIAGVRELMRLCYQKGHRRIAFIHGEDGPVTARRLEGYHLACAELGIPLQTAYLRQGLFRNPGLCFELAMEMLKQPEPPTCILFPDDLTCIGVITMLAGAGVRVPQDLSAIGFDGIMMSQLIHPKLTTCLQDTRQAARMAMDALMDAIDHPDTHTPARRLFPPRILEGETLAAL